jgi:putative membrane protein
MPGREEMITMMFWYGGGWAWWQAGLMWFAMITFWALLIWAIYTLITGVTRRTDQQGGSEQNRGGEARRILDERLARGEIDAEEYRRLAGILDVGAGRSPAGTGSRQ